VLFDVEPDQRSGVADFLTARGIAPSGFIPVVPARITAVNSRPIGALRDSTRRGFSRAALSREYRNTYRDTLIGGEEVTAGRWWGPTDGAGSPSRPPSAPDTIARISVEEDLAKALGLSVGSRVTWDVQGVRLESEVTSIRRVEWARFQPNFFVVFKPGALEDAPQTYVTLYPNITSVDISLVEESLDQVLTKVTTAIRFMALFSVASGVTILIGGIVASRVQREREVLLLRTIGARNAQIRGILFTEYFMWGSLAGAVGLLLAGAAGWGVMRFVFDLPFVLPWKPLLAAGVAVAGLTTAIGWVNSWDLLRKSPLAGWRTLID
jgi:putative ABC transport system permease protein